MHFSKVSRSRSICINGDWDNTLYEMTIQDGESLTKAEEAIEQKLIEWETKVRTQRTPPEQSFTKATDLVKKVNADIAIASDHEIERQFENFKQLLIDTPTKKLAETLLSQSEWKFNLELKKIINSK